MTLLDTSSLAPYLIQHLRIDTSKWDWNQFWDVDAFQWKVGITPFSNPQVILYAWLIYFITITSIRVLVKGRATGYNLSYVSALHNLILCVWSAAMFGFGALQVYNRVQTRGLPEIFCTLEADSLKGPLFYVYYIYYISKFYELLDTVILALKKKNIMFLHWYHHSIVILMTHLWLTSPNLYASLGLLFNTFIHVWMYYYYFRTSLGKPVWFKKYLTSGQILQFMSSFLLSGPYLYYHISRGCSLGAWAFILSMICNASFLLLFIRFYKKAYKSGAMKTDVKATKSH